MSRIQGRRVDQDGKMKFYTPNSQFNDTSPHPVSAMNKHAMTKDRFAPNMKIEQDSDGLNEIELSKMPRAHNKHNTLDQNIPRSHTHRIK